MIGIGPYLTHKDTPFREQPNGSLAQTLRLIGILRLLFPYALIPATTALGTIHPQGREMGLRAGANVVMPNLSPVSVRKLYTLYEDKICTGRNPPSAEAVWNGGWLRRDMPLSRILATCGGDFIDVWKHCINPSGGLYPVFPSMSILPFEKICIKSICILRKICYNIKAIRNNNFACDTAYKFFPCFLKRCLRFHSAARYGICVMPS